jgi:hypothetical protein
MHVSGKRHSFVSLCPATSRNKTEMGSPCVFWIPRRAYIIQAYIIVTFVSKRWMLSAREAFSPFTAALSRKLDEQ